MWLAVESQSPHSHSSPEKEVCAHSMLCACCTMTFHFLTTLCTEPQMSPHNVTVERLNGTAMNVSWTRLSVVEAQSIAVAYVVSYSPQNFRKRQIREVVLPANQSYVVISGLNPVTIYQVEVFASNEYGQSLPANAEYAGEFYTYVCNLDTICCDTS